MSSVIQTEHMTAQRTKLAVSAQPFYSSSLDRFAPLLVFFSCFAYLCIFLHYSSLEPDEGIVLQGAERIIAGQLPYRDFFSFYTPGSLYLLAGLFRVFGDSFAVARISLAATGAICSLFTYVLARRVCSRNIALFVAMLATTAGAAFRFLVLHNPYSTLACCACLYGLIRWFETRKPIWAFTAGSLASMTFLLEQSKGGGLFLGLVLALVILRVCDREFRLGRAALIASAIGVFSPMAVTFAYFGANHAMGQMLQCWLWPLQHYTQANHVAYGHQNWSDRTRELIFYTGPLWTRLLKSFMVLPGLLIPVLPLITFGLLVYWSIQLFRRDTSPEVRYYVGVCSVLTGLLVSIVIVRPDILHFMYLAPLWYLVLAWFCDPLATRSSTLRRLRDPLIAFVWITFGLLSMAVLLTTTAANHRIETRRGRITTGAPDTVLAYVQQHVPPHGRMLVYPYLPLYNYLSATLSPSRYDYFQPGMNTHDQAREIVASLESSNAPVLFEPAFAEKIANSWPQTSLKAIVEDPVSDYIVRNYHICQRLRSPEDEQFEFMVKRERPCS